MVKGFPVPWLHSLPVLGSDLAPQGALGSQPRWEAAWMVIVFVRAGRLRAQWLSLLTEPPLQWSLCQGIAQKPTRKEHFPGLFLPGSLMCSCG